jgi:hypothetical protein
MRKELILIAKEEAERFLDRVRELDKRDPLERPKGAQVSLINEGGWWPNTNCGARINGAVTRASLDLTAALARMRREY